MFKLLLSDVIWALLRRLRWSILPGLDLIYCVDLDNFDVKVFGGSGRHAGQFADAAGIAIDKSGNLVIADARNHRLQVRSHYNRSVAVFST